MAKQAKDTESELPARAVSAFVREILEHYDNIESARGKYMNSARREREGMTAIYEGMAARGVSQKASKTQIKILRLIEKLKGLMTDLENEDRKMVERLAKLHGDPQQLALFPDEPQPKPKRSRKKAAPDNVVPIKSELDEIGNVTQGAA